MFAPEFVLRTTPPRMQRTALERAALQPAWEGLRDRAVIAMIAPAGFGKTTLLTQWRRQWLEQGALVAWLGADDEDDPSRFTQGLLHALRTASGRASFDALMAQCAGQPGRDIDVVTQLLAEVAHAGMKTVLVLDDAERLPPETVQRTLQYLLLNAPANLQVVIASRVALPLQTWELTAKGHYARLGAEDLRLRLEESIALLGKRFGRRLGPDDCARLHEITGGWPLGLLLVAATLEHEPDPAAAIDGLSARHGDIERYFLEALVSRLPAPLMTFLTRVAILDHLSAELCNAVTGGDDAQEVLARLVVDTPIASAGELDGWLRLHPLARDFLLSRFEQLPADERRALHTRASAWFAQREQFHEAACHALAAGDAALAESYATRALWSLAVRGQLLEAREWLARIPPQTVAADVDLQLVAAWIRALGDSQGGALPFLRGVLDDPAMDPRRRFVAARAAGTAASYCDRPGWLPELLHAWLGDALPPPEDRDQNIAYTNCLGMIALHAGDTQRLRDVVQRLPPGAGHETLRLPVAHARVLVGVSHLFDDDPLRAQAVIGPELAATERGVGRRSMVATMFAVVQAAALLMNDRAAEAQGLLANRLDVVERTSPPDIVLLAYQTLAGVALAEGDERRALMVLEALAAHARTHQMPRLLAHSLAGQVRLFALRGCLETADGLLDALAQLTATFAEPGYTPFQPLHGYLLATARAHVALAREQLDAAQAHLAEAEGYAARTHRARDALTLRVLRAVLARRRHAPEALPLLAEARDLAALRGDERLLADTHPLAVRMAEELADPPRHDARAAPAARERPAPTRSGLLTSKETQILVLLGKGLSNKLIARALGVSDETVKWHIKNLFLKLAAGTRKHAVDRARVLGLLVD
jgi:LuxR family maltose regulon positive regulatory protein